MDESYKIPKLTTDIIKQYATLGKEIRDMQNTLNSILVEDKLKSSLSKNAGQKDGYLKTFLSTEDVKQIQDVINRCGVLQFRLNTLREGGMRGDDLEKTKKIIQDIQNGVDTLDSMVEAIEQTISGGSMAKNDDDMKIYEPKNQGQPIQDVFANDIVDLLGKSNLFCKMPDQMKKRNDMTPQTAKKLYYEFLKLANTLAVILKSGTLSEMNKKAVEGQIKKMGRAHPEFNSVLMENFNVEPELLLVNPFDSVLSEILFVDVPQAEIKAITGNNGLETEEKAFKRQSFTGNVQKVRTAFGNEKD